MNVKKEAAITSDLKKFQMRSVFVSGLNRREPFCHQGFSLTTFTFFSSTSNVSTYIYLL